MLEISVMVAIDVIFSFSLRATKLSATCRSNKNCKTEPYFLLSRHIFAISSRVESNSNNLVDGCSDSLK